MGRSQVTYGCEERHRSDFFRSGLRKWQVVWASDGPRCLTISERVSQDQHSGCLKIT